MTKHFQNLCKASTNSHSGSLNMNTNTNESKIRNAMDNKFVPNAPRLSECDIPTICTFDKSNKNFIQPSCTWAKGPRDNLAPAGANPNRSVALEMREETTSMPNTGANGVEVKLILFRLTILLCTFVVFLIIHKAPRPANLFIDLEVFASFFSLLIQTKEYLSISKDGVSSLPAVVAPAGSVMYWLFVFPHLCQTLSASVLFLHSSIWIFTWLEFFVSNRRIKVHRDILTLIVLHACWVLANLIVVRFFTQDVSLFYYKIEGLATGASLQNVNNVSNVKWCLELVCLIFLFICGWVIDVFKKFSERAV